MKNSKILFLTILAAATMSVPAWAETIMLTNGGIVPLENAAATSAGNTYSYSAPAAGTDEKGGWIQWGNQGINQDVALGTVENNVQLTGTGLIGLTFKVGDGSHLTEIVDLRNTNANTFSGRLTVINQWNNNTMAKVSGANWANTEFVFGGVSRESNSGAWAIKRMYGNSDRGNDTLALQGATSFAGITGTSKGFTPTQTLSGESSIAITGTVNDHEFITVANSGDVLTLIGTGTYAFYGTVGTSIARVGITKTGTGTQKFGGKLYLDTVSVATGTLDLSGATVSLTSAISNSGTVVIDSSTKFDLSKILAGENNVYTLISGGTISGWTSSNLTKEDFTFGGNALADRQSVSISAENDGKVTVSGLLNLTWARTEESSAWDTTSQNWKNGETATTFANGDLVIFDETATSKTVFVAAGTNLVVGTMTVSDDYKFTGESSGTSSIGGAKLSIAAGKTMTLGDSGNKIDLNFENISISGMLKVNTNSIDHNWSKISFDAANANFHIEDAGMSVAFGETAVNAAAAITANWNPNNGIVLGKLSGTANLTLNQSTQGNLTYKISGASYTGKLINKATTSLLAGETMNIASWENWSTIQLESGAKVFVSGNAETSKWSVSSYGAKILNIGENASLNVSGNFTNDSGLALTNNGIIEVTGDFWYKSGSGWNTNTFSGNGFVLAGKLRVGNQTQLTLENNNFIIGANGIAQENNGALRLGTVNIGAQANWASSMNMGLSSATGTTFNTGTFDKSSKTFSNSDGKIITLSGVISNAIEGTAGKIIKQGAGTLALSGANTFTGGVEIMAGTLEAANASALGAGTQVAKIAGGQLKIANASAAITLNAATIEIVLSDKYDNSKAGSVAAIIGVSGSALANGTKILLSKADASVLAFSVDAAISQYQFKIADSTIAGSLAQNDFSLNKSWAGWAITNYDTTNGTLTLTIPEPSIFGLLAGLGALALVGARRRRKTK